MATGIEKHHNWAGNKTLAFHDLWVLLSVPLCSDTELLKQKTHCILSSFLTTEQLFHYHKDTIT